MCLPAINDAFNRGLERAFLAAIESKPRRHQVKVARALCFRQSASIYSVQSDSAKPESCPHAQQLRGVVTYNNRSHQAHAAISRVAAQALSASPSMLRSLAVHSA